jgi:hypothetical protein
MGLLKTDVVAAQPGWFLVFSDGSEEPIIAWAIEFVTREDDLVPSTTPPWPVIVPRGAMSINDIWAVKYPEGTGRDYFIPEEGAFKTKEEVMKRLVEKEEWVNQFRRKVGVR